MVSFLQGLGAVGGGLVEGFERGSDIADKRKKRQREDEQYKSDLEGSSAFAKYLQTQGQQAPQQTSQPMAPSPMQGATPQASPGPMTGGGDMSRYSAAIAGNETGGQSNPYATVGVPSRTGDRPYGKYQVMGANVPQWTQQVLGQPMTPQQFLASPQAQEAVFKSKFGEYVQKTGSPSEAAKMWLGGEHYNPNARDALGTTPGAYAQNFDRRMGGAPQQGGMPQQQAGGGHDWRQVATGIMQANPGMSPMGLMKALEHAQPYMSMESREQMAELRGVMAERLAGIRERGKGERLQEGERGKGERLGLQEEGKSSRQERALQEKAKEFSIKENFLRDQLKQTIDEKKASRGEKSREFDSRLDFLNKQLDTVQGEKRRHAETVEAQGETRLGQGAARLDLSREAQDIRKEQGERRLQQGETRLGQGAARLDLTAEGLKTRRALGERGLDIRERLGGRSLDVREQMQRRSLEAAAEKATGTQKASLDRAMAVQDRIDVRAEKRLDLYERKFTEAKTEAAKRRVLDQWKQAHQDARADAGNLVKLVASGVAGKTAKSLETELQQKRQEEENRIKDLEGQIKTEGGARSDLGRRETTPKGPVKVSSPEEAKKLPSGTPIILPDGTEGVVP